MKDSKFSNLCSVFIITSLLLITFTSASYSQSYQLNKTYGMQSINNTQGWTDKSGDLPGMMSDEEKVLLVVVVAAGVGLILYMIANNNSDDAESKNKTEVKDEDANTDIDTDDFGYLSPLMKKKSDEEIPINVYLGMKRNNNQFSDNTFQIGVSYNF